MFSYVSFSLSLYRLSSSCCGADEVTDGGGACSQGVQRRSHLPVPSANPQLPFCQEKDCGAGIEGRGRADEAPRLHEKVPLSLQHRSIIIGIQQAALPGSIPCDRGLC